MVAAVGRSVHRFNTRELPAFGDRLAVNSDNIKREIDGIGVRDRTPDTEPVGDIPKRAEVVNAEAAADEEINILVAGGVGCPPHLADEVSEVAATGAGRIKPHPIEAVAEGVGCA